MNIAYILRICIPVLIACLVATAFSHYYTERSHRAVVCFITFSTVNGLYWGFYGPITRWLSTCFHKRNSPTTAKS